MVRIRDCEVMVACGQVDAKGVEATTLDKRVEVCAEERSTSLSPLEAAQTAIDEGRTLLLDHGKNRKELKTQLKVRRKMLAMARTRTD